MNELALNNLVTEIKFFENQAVVSYWEIGKRLAQAKEQVGYGNWDKWLSDNLNYSKSMADKLIRVSEEIKDSQSIAKLNFTQVLALTSVDEETRTKIIKNEQLEDKTVKETQEIIKKYKEEKAELEEENQGLKKANEELSRIAEKEPEVIEREVIREVKPDDYDFYKKQYDKLIKDLAKAEREIVNYQLAHKKKAEELGETQRKEKVTADINDFVWNANNFIGKVGGLLYLTEYLGDMEKRERDLFTRSAKALLGWAYQLNENIKIWEE